MIYLAMNEIHAETVAPDKSLYNQNRRAMTPATSAAKEPEGISSDAPELLKVLLEAVGAELEPEAAELTPMAELTLETVTGPPVLAERVVGVAVALSRTRKN